MKTQHTEKNTTLWEATGSKPFYPALLENLHAEVCVVGAGIAGLTTAYLLAKEGKSVVVIDDGPVAGGMTGRTSAHLASALDDRYHRIASLHGKKGASIAAQSHAAAIDLIETICREEGIECDFRRVNGYLFAPPGAGTDELLKEREAAKNAGLPVRMIERAPVPGFDTGQCLRFSNQAQFHPLKYMAGLAAAAEKYGARICCNTHVTEIKGGSDARVKTEAGHEVRAGSIVVATNVPVNNLFAIHTKQAPYTTYAIAAKYPAPVTDEGLFYDLREEDQMPDGVSSDSYHYVRFYIEDGAAEGWLIAGGRDHKTGQQQDAESRYEHLENWAKGFWPQMGQVEYRWSGQVMEPVDSMAFIGPNPLDDDNVYVVTGDSGNGLTHGTLGAILLTDLIRGRENPWADLYNPSRISLKAAPEFLKENLNVAGQLVKDYTSAGEVKDKNSILPGEGALMRKGMKKVAVYRDENGQFYERSAACPHLGCIVHWNGDEKTWDCPCHGSRFDRHGHVLTGPANKDLEETTEAPVQL